MALAQNGQELYAVAFELYEPRSKRWIPNIEYIHADSAAHAELHYKTLYPNRRTCKIIGASLAIGFFAEDRHGDKVSAS